MKALKSFQEKSNKRRKGGWQHEQSFWAQAKRSNLTTSHREMASLFQLRETPGNDKKAWNSRLTRQRNF